MADTEPPEAYLAALKDNPAYADLDVEKEYHRMVAWCGANRKVPSKRRLINWLNKAEKPLFGPNGKVPTVHSRPTPPAWRPPMDDAGPLSSSERDVLAQQMAAESARIAARHGHETYFSKLLHDAAELFNENARRSAAGKPLLPLKAMWQRVNQGLRNAT